MKLKLQWSTPVPLRRDQYAYTIDLESIPREAGVYIFARRYNRSFEALYVGRSNNIRGRIKQHLNSVRLMKHLKQAKTGRRVLIFGIPMTKPGQRLDKVLISLEKAFIRHYLLEGHDLVNAQGVTIREHEIESVGRIPRAFIPSKIYIEQ